MKYQINLLQEKEKNISDKIIFFALHYLRYILVLTQLVVIFVFFYRFKIDQEIIDLKDELTQKKEIVSISDSLLKEAEAADNKMNEIRGLTTKQELFQKMLEYFLNNFPAQMIVKKLDIKENYLEFEAYSQSANLINLYFNKLKKDKQFKVVDLSNIKKTETGYVCYFKLQDFILVK